MVDDVPKFSLLVLKYVAFCTFPLLWRRSFVAYITPSIFLCPVNSISNCSSTPFCSQVYRSSCVYSQCSVVLWPSSKEEYRNPISWLLHPFQIKSVRWTIGREETVVKYIEVKTFIGIYSFGLDVPSRSRCSSRKFLDMDSQRWLIEEMTVYHRPLETSIQSNHDRQNSNYASNQMVDCFIMDFAYSVVELSSPNCPLLLLTALTEKSTLVEGWDLPTYTLVQLYWDSRIN